MGINEKAGEVFSVAAENSPVAGCTVSKAVAEVAGGTNRVRLDCHSRLPQ